MLRDSTALQSEKWLPDAGEFALNVGFLPRQLIELEVVPPTQREFSLTPFAADSPNVRIFCSSDWVVTPSRAFWGFEVRSKLKFFGIAQNGQVWIEPLIANIEFRGFTGEQTQAILQNAIASQKLRCMLDPSNVFVAANGDRVVPFTYKMDATGTTSTDQQRLEAAKQKRLRKAAKRQQLASKWVSPAGTAH